MNGFPENASFWKLMVPSSKSEVAGQCPPMLLMLLLASLTIGASACLRLVSKLTAMFGGYWIAFEYTEKPHLRVAPTLNSR